MPILDKEKRKENKIKRQASKDAKLGAQISSETEKAGIDLKAPVSTGPLGSKEKAEIDKRISSATEDDLKEGLSKFQQLYKAPDITTPKAPSEDQLKRSLRSEKRARLGGILTGMARGFRGQTVDASKFRSSKIRSEREAQYQQYKDDVKAAKQRKEEWGTGYAKQQIDYLNSLKGSETSDLKKKHIQAQIDKITAETKYIQNKPYSTRATKVKPTYTHQTEEGNWNITNQKLPYSDLYYKITGNSPNIINEVAKLAGHATNEAGTLKKNLSSAEIERFSNTMLSKAFDIQVDENGNQIAIPKPGRENFMQDLSTSIALTNKLKADKKRINAERDTELNNVTDPWGPKNKESERERINAEYDVLIAESEEGLKQSESKLKQMLSGDYTSEAPPEEKPTGKSPLDDIYNS